MQDWNIGPALALLRAVRAGDREFIESVPATVDLDKLNRAATQLMKYVLRLSDIEDTPSDMLAVQRYILDPRHERAVWGPVVLRRRDLSRIARRRAHTYGFIVIDQLLTAHVMHGIQRLEGEDERTEIFIDLKADPKTRRRVTEWVYGLGYGMAVLIAVLAELTEDNLDEQLATLQTHAAREILHDNTD